MIGKKAEIDLDSVFMNANGILVDEAQLEKEKAYVVPSESEIKSKFKISRLEVRNKFDSA